MRDLEMRFTALSSAIIANEMQRRERDSNPRVPKDISWRVIPCTYDLEADPF
jgi:hypothetical protein